VKSVESDVGYLEVNAIFNVKPMELGEESVNWGEKNSSQHVQGYSVLSL